MIDVSLFLVILIYLLVCLIYLLFLICLLGDSKKHSKCKRNFEDIFNRTKDISNSPRWVIRLSLWFIRLCLWLYCITEAGNNHGTKWPKSLYILQMYYKKNRIWVISCNNKDIVPCAINISRKQILHRTNDAKKQLIQASENDIFI